MRKRASEHMHREGDACPQNLSARCPEKITALLLLLLHDCVLLSPLGSGRLARGPGLGEANDVGSKAPSLFNSALLAGAAIGIRHRRAEYLARGHRRCAPAPTASHPLNGTCCTVCISPGLGIAIHGAIMD